MAKRSSSARIAEVREKSEISCMWGLFSILESCQGHATHKLISNGRPISKHIIGFESIATDNPRKLIQPASFDEECQKLKNEPDLVTKEAIVKRKKSTKTGSELIEHLSNTPKKARKKSQQVYQPSSALASTSTSGEVSLNKLKFAAILEALCAQNHREEITLSEVLQRSISAKALLDQMFLERRFEGTRSGSRSFSHALEVLNSNKDLWQNVDYTHKRPPDKIVILKPAPRNATLSENLTCHCSSHAKIARFSFKEMRKKLKHTFQGSKVPHNRSILNVRESCTCHDVDTGDDSHAVCKRKGVESNLERKKVDFSSNGYTTKHEFDVIMEAKKHLSTRLKNVKSVENPTSKRSPKTLGRILASPELDIWPRSPRSDEHDCSHSAHMRFSPYCLSPLRPKKEVTSFDDYDKITRCSPISNDEEGIETKCNGELRIGETNTRPELHVSSEINSTETIALHKEHEIEETCTSPLHDFPSTPSRTCHPEMAESNKHQEEHRSPISVLEPFFVEDSNSPSSVTPRTRQFSSGQPLQPLRLDFEEHSFESLTPRPSTQTSTFIEDQDYISHYVHLVLQASCLTWDNLSEMRPWTQPEEMLDPSLFDDLLDFLPTDCYFDPKLLFDHMNEVLQEIYQSHFSLSPWLSSFVKGGIRSVPLEELVLDEIMNEADFYLLPWTEERTLDQLVSKDVARCGSWPNVRHDTERIVIDVSNDLVEGCIVDVLLELHL